jgi:nucleoside-diphosphate-sugar epimerase
MSVFLVTGGAGFIGSHLVDRLVQRGHRVRVLDNFETGKHQNLADAMNRIDLVEGDVRNWETVQKALRDAAVVFHLAALGSVPRSVNDPLTTDQVNVRGTLNLLVAAREAKAKRFVFSSSSSVYGETAVVPQHEAQPCKPISPYGVTKLAGEQYCRVFWHTYGVQTICLRYFNVFGPRQDPASQYAAAIPRFVSRLLRNEPPIIFDDGEQSRGFTYVDDVVDANLLAAAIPEARGQAVNISAGSSVTVNQVVRELRALLGKDIEPVYAPARPGDIRHSLADIAAARQLLGYEPRVDFQEGLRRSIDWYRRNLA